VGRVAMASSSAARHRLVRCAGGGRGRARSGAHSRGAVRRTRRRHRRTPTQRAPNARRLGRRVDGGTGRRATSRHATDDFVREVNENIAELGERFGLQEETLELICECGEPDCGERLAIPAEEYERLRAAGYRVVAPGHEHGRGGEPRDGYVVVD
jgi:hypothetical protein